MKGARGILIRKIRDAEKFMSPRCSIGGIGIETDALIWKKIKRVLEKEGVEKAWQKLKDLRTEQAFKSK